MNDEQAGGGSPQEGLHAEAESDAARTDDSIHGSFERIIASGKDMVEAELAWAKLKGRSLAGIAQRGFAFALVAMVGLMVGLSLLLVAAIVALAPHVGLLYATLIVIGISFAIAIIFGLFARRAFRQLLGGDEP